MRHGADISATTKNGWTALHLAAYQAQSQMLDMLLTCNADINAREKLGRTPLDVVTDSPAPLAKVCIVELIYTAVAILSL